MERKRYQNHLCDIVGVVRSADEETMQPTVGDVMDHVLNRANLLGSPCQDCEGSTWHPLIESGAAIVRFG